MSEKQTPQPVPETYIKDEDKALFVAKAEKPFRDRALASQNHADFLLVQDASQSSNFEGFYEKPKYDPYEGLDPKAAAEAHERNIDINREIQKKNGTYVDEETLREQYWNPKEDESEYEDDSDKLVAPFEQAIESQEKAAEYNEKARKIGDIAARAYDRQERGEEIRFSDPE